MQIKQMILVLKTITQIPRPRDIENGTSIVDFQWLFESPKKSCYRVVYSPSGLKQYNIYRTTRTPKHLTKKTLVHKNIKTYIRIFF